jgi:hypothetical protein
MKVCKICKKEKSLDQFRDFKIKNGYSKHPYCKECARLDMKRRRDEKRALKVVHIPKIKENTNYLANRKLTYELIVSKEMGKLTKDAERMFLLMIKNISRKFRYANPDDRLDCESEAAYQIFKNWKSFDPDKSENSFAFVTEVLKRGFAQGFNRIYKKNDDGGYWNPTPFSVMFNDGHINI